MARRKPPPPWGILGIEIDIADEELRKTVKQTRAAMSATVNGKPLKLEEISISLPAAFLDVAAVLAKKKGTSRNEVVRILASDALVHVVMGLSREIGKAEKERSSE